MAGVLSSAQRSQIVKLSQQLRAETGSDLVVLTAGRTAKDAYSPKEQATTLFNAWGLGSREKNNGVLIELITGAYMGERRLEVEIGFGLNSAYGSEENALGPRIQA